MSVFFFGEKGLGLREAAAVLAWTGLHILTLKTDSKKETMTTSTTTTKTTKLHQSLSLSFPPLDSKAQQKKKLFYFLLKLNYF